MSLGLIGKKCGMTRVFQDDGTSVPVTVLEVLPNRITQIKTLENDGYQAIQVTTGARRAHRVTKPLAKHFAKANVEAGRGLWEFSVEELAEGVTVGSELNLEMLGDTQFVDVAGTSKGKGFAGAIKRHNFSSQRMTHGNSLSHRAPGSIGQNQTPGRVFKGKRMAGQMGNKRCTVQNLKVVRVDNERNLLLLKGAVPGAPGTNVVVKAAVKKASDKK
jgi:large subunit ribosomal protein L3